MAYWLVIYMGSLVTSWSIQFGDYWSKADCERAGIEATSSHWFRGPDYICVSHPAPQVRSVTTPGDQQ